MALDFFIIRSPCTPYSIYLRGTISVQALGFGCRGEAFRLWGWWFRGEAFGVQGLGLVVQGVLSV